MMCRSRPLGVPASLFVGMYDFFPIRNVTLTLFSLRHPTGNLLQNPLSARLHSRIMAAFLLTFSFIGISNAYSSSSFSNLSSISSPFSGLIPGLPVFALERRQELVCEVPGGRMYQIPLDGSKVMLIFYPSDLRCDSLLWARHALRM